MAEITVEVDMSAWADKLTDVSVFFKSALQLFLDERMHDLESFVGDNNARIWVSRGANIGANWEGHELVDTGALRASMESVRLERRGDVLVWSSDLDYAEHVDESYEIYGADDTLKQRIIESFGAFVENRFQEIMQ